MNLKKGFSPVALSLVVLAAVPSASFAMDMKHSQMSMHDGMKKEMMQETALELNYTQEAFDAAQKAGKHIVVDVFKKGCPTCKAQKPSLVKAQMMYPDAVFFRVDFSNQKEAVKRFKATKQSTIIVFDGMEETGRALGETRKSKLLKLVATAA